MRNWTGKRYWVVGASEGLGRSLSQVMSRAGIELVLSARSEDKLNALAADLPAGAQVVPMDISDKASVVAAAEQVGPVDGVVFLAGVYTPMSAQEWDAEKVEQMFEVNLTGAARVLGQVIGDMVEKDKGHIVLTGSLSAYRGLPGAIGYSASKAGLMALAESMHGDLRKTGVEVQLVNPGFIKTRLTDQNDFDMPFIMDPDDAAKEVFEHMNTDHFVKAFPLLFSLVFRLSRLLPTALYEALFFRR